MSKDHARGRNERDNSSENLAKMLCTDSKLDLNSGKTKSIKYDFCKKQYCFMCSKLKQALFNEIGKEESILWTCSHCRIPMPGVNQMMTSIRNLEMKVGEIQN